MASSKTKSRKGLDISKTLKLSIAMVLVIGVSVVVFAVLMLQRNSDPSATPTSQVTTQDYHALILEPGDSDSVYFGHHGGILKSSDGGSTWSEVPGIGQDAMNLAVSHTSPQVMYLAGHNVFMKSEDGGQSWRDVQNDLPGLDLHWFVMDPDDLTKLYANSVGFGLYQSTDGGSAWTPWDMEIPGDSSITALAVLGGNPENVLVGTDEGKLLLSPDGAASWEEVGIIDSTPLAFAMNRDTVSIYLGTSKGLYRSDDKGLSWIELPLNTRVMALATGGSDPERVLVVNDKGEIFRSDDAGRTW